MRWQSSGSRVALRSDFTTGGPIVKLGTKCPSMMSTWMTLPPPAAARSTWSAKWAKSAERIEGASSIKTGNLGLPKGRLLSGDFSTVGPCDVSKRRSRYGCGSRLKSMPESDWCRSRHFDQFTELSLHKTGQSPTFLTECPQLENVLLKFGPRTIT